MSAHAKPTSPVPLEAVISTEELKLRPSRMPEHEAVTAALITLAQTMANSPEHILQKLVNVSLDLCRAHSSGLSLLEEENGRKIFRWHGVAGVYAPHLWGTTPREFSPCGTVLDTDKVQLMSHLDRHFGYFAQVKPHIEEALLVPFHVDGVAVGTMWVISHDQTRQFDAEDARVLSTLGEFAAAAYKALSGTIALKSIVATIREPLLVLDAECRVRSASRSFYETFHATPEVTEGRFLSQLGAGEWDIPGLTARLQDVLAKENVIETLEITRNFPSLGRRVMSLNARRLWCEGTPAALILLAIDDITSRKHIEEELLRSSEDAQRFAYVAAHDLRAPLNTSLILLQLLKEAKLDDDDRRKLAMAKDGLRRLQSLMSDILTYALVEGVSNRGTLPLQEPLDIALANLDKEIKEAGAKIDIAPLPTLEADRSLLTLVFQNVISNALKFRTDEPPWLQIGVATENRVYIISVADNGQGFEPEFAEQIFLPFKRLHGPETPGSGIGLATCKRIIERLGGRIWAESAKGKGATFYFTLRAD